MGSLESDLIAFYDQQAPLRERRRPEHTRTEALRRFLDQLALEHRTRVLEVGAGAGHDARTLADVQAVVALDLSIENGRLCRAKRVPAVVGSGAALPFRTKAFEALWTMSTLLHVPNDGIDAVMAEFVRVVAPGSPIAVGVWGGDDHEEIFADDELEPKRYYCFRSDDTMRALCDRHGALELFLTWTSDKSDQHYQYAVLRTPARS